MILYYSGTGNSKYVADKIASCLNDKSLNLFERIRNKDYSEIYSEKAFVVVCPTYGWQIPHLLRDYFLNIKLSGSEKIYFVMTCGEDIGNAGKYIMNLCDKIKLNYMGCAEIVMPENYIALFNAPETNEAILIIHKAENSIQSIVSDISNNKQLNNKKISLIDKGKSCIINPLFYTFVVKDKKFTVNESCISCGKCAEHCIMNNISMKDKKPHWNHNCTHCMSCICGCPVSAIEYGKASVGKPRYQCPIK